MIRGLRVVLVLLLGLSFGSPGAPQSARAVADCQLFPETSRAVCEPFLTYWREHGGVAQQGYPLSDEFTAVNPTDGRAYRTQYFERARFEFHSGAPTAPAVLLGLLGREQLLAQYPTGVFPPPLLDPFPDPSTSRECVEFAETGQQLCSVFLEYWRAHGGLAQQGFPLTGVFDEVNPTDGRRYPTQYFERARFEYHTEIPDSRERVVLGLLGREQLQLSYPAAPPPVPSPQAGCDPSYPTVCIPPPPPIVGCGQIPYRNFPVRQPDPHHLDGDGNGIGCDER